MNSLSKLTCLGFLLISHLGFAAPADEQKSASSERPNILFIFSDDHAPNAISCYPGGLFDEISPTPGIDRIAKEGMRFDRSYCGNSICGPSRATILTGLHSHMNGFIDNNNSYFDGLQTTFPNLLRDAGYTTAMIGKWHLHSNPVGFDYWEILPGQGSYYNPDFIQMNEKRQRFEGHCNDLVTEKGLTWLKQAADSKKPFMAMLQYKAPHRNWSPAFRHLDLFDGIEMPEPDSLFDDYANRSSVLGEQAMSIEKDMSWNDDLKFQGPILFPSHFIGNKNHQFPRLSEADQKIYIEAYREENEKFIADMKAGKLDRKAIIKWKYQRYIKEYLAVIRSMDEGIEKVLKHLDDTGLAENTIVIYSSDQGFYLGEHGWYDKRWMFEESLMMPFVVRWPGKIKPGSVSQAMIQNIDYGPTFLDLAGAEIPPAMQGKSLVPLFKASGEAPEGWRDSIYYRYSGERTHRVAAHDGVRTADHKLFWVPKTKEYQLFDLKKDPKEMASVHQDPAYAEVLSDMTQKLTDARLKYRVHSANIATEKDQPSWQKRYIAMNKKAKATAHDLLFIGDSITQGWEGRGKATWEKHYANRNALNLGISGDRTEHVIWRLNNRNLANQRKAKAAVIMIGTNNTGHKEQDPSEVKDGIERILSTVRARCPDAKILLLGVFPRGVKSDDPKRLNNVEINKLISKFHNGKRIHYLDISDQFLSEDGTLSKEIMPDALHLSPQGYQIWADAIEPKLKEFGL